MAVFGPQGWWPVTVRAGVPVYRPGFWGELTEGQRVEICIGAILTQNASWTNVLKALESLRGQGVRKLSDVEKLPSGRLQRLIRSSGYFKQKTRKLKIFARYCRARRLGRWLSGPLAAVRSELLGLWGVGPETADSILLYAGRRPVFVVDAYTLRIGRRLGWFRDPSYHDAQAYLTGRLASAAKLFGEFHALLVTLAKNFCRTRPLCAGCPLLVVCSYGRRIVSSRA